MTLWVFLSKACQWNMPPQTHPHTDCLKVRCFPQDLFQQTDLTEFNSAVNLPLHDDEDTGKSSARLNATLQV